MEAWAALEPFTGHVVLSFAAAVEQSLGVEPGSAESAGRRARRCSDLGTRCLGACRADGREWFGSLKRRRGLAPDFPLRSFSGRPRATAP